MQPAHMITSLTKCYEMMQHTACSLCICPSMNKKLDSSSQHIFLAVTKKTRI
uniref:Uncharacterized protein n=1 Tax=Arion vulgaris TaxID=1028688 RepID=A0A0B7A5A0_9EUPU